MELTDTTGSTALYICHESVYTMGYSEAQNLNEKFMRLLGAHLPHTAIKKQLQNTHQKCQSFPMAIQVKQHEAATWVLLLSPKSNTGKPNTLRAVPPGDTRRVAL